MENTATSSVSSEKNKSSMLRMAEPSHRDVPMGASTGQSIRAYPKSCIQQVKDVCLFYVSKCSGKYEDNVTAARYVHQMAEEVIALLAGVAGEIKRNKSEPELFQKLLDEWNENFPSSLGAMGSPKAIAALISKQAVELNDLRSALEGERNRRDKDVSEILRSMDAQLQAYRNSVMSERRHQQLVEQQQQEAYKLAAEEVKRTSEDRFELLTSKQNLEISQMRESFEKQVERLQRRITSYQEKTQQNHEHYLDRIEKVKASKQKKYDKLLAKYRVAQEKYYQLACTVQDDPSCLSNPSFDETTVLSRMDFELPEEEEEDNEEVEQLASGPGANRASANIHIDDDDEGGAAAAANTAANVTATAAAAAAEAGAETPTKSKSTKTTSFDASADKPDKKKRSSGSGVSGGGGGAGGGSSGSFDSGGQRRAFYEAQLAADMRVRFLTEQLENHRALAVEDKGTINSLVEEIHTLRAEIDTYLLRLREFESLNETYRQSLAMRVGVRPSEVPPFAHHTLKSAPKAGKGCSRTQCSVNKILCHTPHFLGPDDKTGCRSNQPVLSGYQVVGKW